MVSFLQSLFQLTAIPKLILNIIFDSEKNLICIKQGKSFLLIKFGKEMK